MGSYRWEVMAKIRTCFKCGFVGNEGVDFYPKQGNTCKACANARSTAWRLEIQAEAGERHMRRKEQMRVANAKRKYGLTATEVRAMYDSRKCEICGGADKRRLNIDHCHRTGKVRGVLCINCNSAIGRMDDDPQRLEAAGAYLRRFVS